MKIPENKGSFEALSKLLELKLIKHNKINAQRQHFLASTMTQCFNDA